MRREGAPKQPGPSLQWMTLARAVLTLGAISEGPSDKGSNGSLDNSHVFESLVTLLGFGILVGSLFAR